MPVLRPLPPVELYRLLRDLGYEVIDETEHNWLLADASDPRSEPVLIPKHGEEVGPDTMAQMSGKPRVGQAILNRLRSMP
jgi:hypothetical protein